MLLCFDNKMDAAQFVNDLLQNFPNASPSITITPQGKFVVCYVSHVIVTGLEETGKELVASSFFATQSNT